MLLGGAQIILDTQSLSVRTASTAIAEGVFTLFAGMSYFFSTPVDIDIVLEDTDDRAMVDMKLDKNRREKAPLYMDGESVKGAVTIRPKDGKRLEHTGIKVQFIGTIGTRVFSFGHTFALLTYGFGRNVLRQRQSL